MLVDPCLHPLAPCGGLLRGSPELHEPAIQSAKGRMSYVTVEAFNACGRNISASLGNAETQWNEHFEDLRGTVIQQQTALGEINAKLHLLNDHTIKTDTKIAYLDTQTEQLVGRC